MLKIFFTFFILQYSAGLNAKLLKNNAPAGAALDVKGSLLLSGTNSGYVGFESASDGGSTTYTLPTADGQPGYALTTNGSGNLKWSGIGRTSCPAGFHLIGTSASLEAFCISSAQETTNTWLGAITNCYNKTTKAHLCSASEWTMSCVAESNGPNNMTGHWEWVADSGNSYGRIIGLAGCDSFNGSTVDAKYTSRCCFR